MAAFVTAMLGGVFTNLVTKNEPETGVAVLENSHEHEHHEHHNHKHRDCEGDHCSCDHDDHDEHAKKSFAQKLKETFEYGFVNMIGDVSKWLTIGLLLGALIAAFVPDDFFLFLHEYPLLCMLVVGKAFGKCILAAYLVSIALGAMFFGFVVDTFFMDSFLASMLPHGSAECHGHGALGVFDYVCAVVFAALIIYAKFAHKGCGCG